MYCKHSFILTMDGLSHKIFVYFGCIYPQVCWSVGQLTTFETLVYFSKAKNQSRTYIWIDTRLDEVTHTMFLSAVPVVLDLI